jgi:hypothetical protein
MSKFTVMFKMPDAGFDAICRAIEQGDIPQSERNKAEKLLGKFLKYDEYVYLEADTVAGTLTVMPRE